MRWFSSFFTQFYYNRYWCYWSKKSKYNDPIKKHKTYTFTNQQEKKKKHQSILDNNYESLKNAVAQFDEKRLDLKHGVIYSKIDQNRSRSKSLFRNNLHFIPHVPCTTTVPPGISCCIVDAIHVVTITITNLTPITLLGWAKWLYTLKHDSIHKTITWDHNSDHFRCLWGRRPTQQFITRTGNKIKGDRKQQLPKTGGSTDFVSSSKKKCHIKWLLADFFLTELSKRCICY